jgi:hypothetical protein
MLFNNVNEPMGIINNPMINSPFIQTYVQGGSPIPPTSSFIVTDPSGSDYIITEDGNRLITED